MNDFEGFAAGERQSTVVPKIWLLQGVVHGNMEAIRECVDAYGPLVWSLARACYPDSREAEKAVEEVFVEIWKAAPDCGGGENEFVFVKKLAIGVLVRRLQTENS